MQENMYYTYTLFIYSNNLVFDVGVQLQDICFPRP